MNDRTEFAGRLRDAMTKAGYQTRPVVLEREFNTRYWGRSVSVQAVRRWLRGEAIPSQEKLQVLAEWLNVEPQTLRFGQDWKAALEAHQNRWEETVGHVEREAFEAFLRLPALQRKIVYDVIMTYAKCYSKST